MVTPIKSSCSLIFLPIIPLIKSNLRLPTYLCKSNPSHANAGMPVSKATGFAGVSLPRPRQPLFSSPVRKVLNVSRTEADYARCWPRGRGHPMERWIVYVWIWLQTVEHDHILLFGEGAEDVWRREGGGDVDHCSFSWPCQAVTDIITQLMSAGCVC